MNKADRIAPTQEVADEFDVSARTVHEWVKNGCPCKRGVKGNRFNLSEVAAWKKANNITGEPGRPTSQESPDIEAAKLRKENALASKYELQVEKERGRLVDVSVAKAAGVSVVTTAKGKLTGLAAAIAPQLQGLDAAEIQTLLGNRIEEILNDLSSGFRAACSDMAGSVQAPAEV